MPGQTLSEIRALLAAAGLAPQHRFGQNFLFDLNLMRKMVAAAELSRADTVLEVGPGTGSLTEMLLDAAGRVIAVEIDHGLARLLAARFAGEPRFELVEGDVLETKHRISPAVLGRLRTPVAAPAPPTSLKLVANLPYQVATPLLIDLLCIEPRFERFCVTIQREVAERLAAGPHTDAYGPVSVAMQSLATVARIVNVPPSAFWPRPKVDSTMLLIRPLPPERSGIDSPAAFARFVQQGFIHPRKKLRNMSWNSPALLDAMGRAGVSADCRPGDLSPRKWLDFYAAARSCSSAA